VLGQRHMSRGWRAAALSSIFLASSEPHWTVVPSLGTAIASTIGIVR
jgi:hypothetical protein